MRRRKRNPETNAERLKRLYVVGRLTLDALMEQVDAQLDAGTLDEPAPVPYPYWDAIRLSAIRPEYAGLAHARDTLAGSDDA